MRIIEVLATKVDDGRSIETLVMNFLRVTESLLGDAASERRSMIVATKRRRVQCAQIKRALSHHIFIGYLIAANLESGSV